MSTKKPNSVYIQIRDAESGKTKSLTCYGAPADTVYSTIEQVLSRPLTQSDASTNEDRPTLAQAG